MNRRYILAIALAILSLAMIGCNGEDGIVVGFHSTQDGTLVVRPTFDGEEDDITETIEIEACVLYLIDLSWWDPNDPNTDVSLTFYCEEKSTTTSTDFYVSYYEGGLYHMYHIHEWEQVANDIGAEPPVYFPGMNHDEQDLYVAINWAEWIEGNGTYEIGPYYNFSGGICPDLPGVYVSNTPLTWDPNVGWYSDNWYTGYDIYICHEFCVIPTPMIAFDPDPTFYATDVQTDQVLIWSPGQGAELHDIYLGPSYNDVNEATRGNPMGVLLSQGQGPNSIDPYGAIGFLKLDTTYYWRVDEVNTTPGPQTIAKGDVWSFTTANYTIVDDFDSYTSTDELREYWSDYYSGNGTSSQIYIETEIVCEGNSMRYRFRNDLWPYYSESYATTADLVMDPNWEGMGAKAMSLWFYGDVNNPTTEPMYIILTDGAYHTATVAYSDINDIKKEEWQEWNINLQDFIDNNPSFNLRNVAQITIRFGDAPAGNDGTVYFDDLRLYTTRCVLAERAPSFAIVDYAPSENPSGDCVIDNQELEIMANDWLTDINPTGWTQVNIGGFGNSNNLCCCAVSVTFPESYLYSGTSNYATGGEIWRSSDGENWTQVSTNGFGEPNNVSTYPWLVFEGNLYAGTFNYATGGEIWRSSDGVTWTHASLGGFGDSNNVGTYPEVVFKGDLYVGTFNYATGGEIWRSSEGVTWTQVNIDGFGDSNNFYTEVTVVFKDNLYVGTFNEVSGTEIWRSSDGVTWTQVNIDGFGDPYNVDSYPTAVFGDKLYVGTSNEATGTEVWRTSNGTTWAQVNIDGFGNPDNIDSYPLAIFYGNLYAGTRNEISGGEVWRTSDGTSWTKVNIDGFEDPHNIMAFPEPVEGFDGKLYVGTFNNATGGEIWKLPLSAAEIYTAEPEGDRAVNFKDFAMVANMWLTEDMFP